MLDKLKLAAFANHQEHFIGIEERFHIRRIFLCREHFKTLKLETIKMPEPGILKFFLHQKMNPCRNAVNIMKFKPGNFFIQYEVIAKIAINQVSYRSFHVGTKKFLRDQVTLGEIINKEGFNRIEPA